MSMIARWRPRMKHRASLALSALIAVGVVSSPPASAQSTSGSAPSGQSAPIGQIAPVAQPEAPSAAADSMALTPTSIGPATGSPFGAITPPGDPFGMTPTSALPPSVVQNAAGFRGGP